MVVAGLVAGLLTGGFPTDLSKPIQQLALIVAMTVSLTEISLRGIAVTSELRGVALAFAMSYGVLGALLIVFAETSAEPSLRSGWVLMAAVPPAVAVVPITSLLRGDVRRALLADAVLYGLGLVLVPGLSVLFLGQTVPVAELALQTLLLIGVPVVASRPLRRSRRIHDARPTAVSGSFFFLVFAIAGSTRGTLLARPELVPGLLLLGLVRTVGLGLVLLGVMRLLAVNRDHRVTILTFAGFKNLGLTVVLSFALFGPVASLPAIASLIFETAWMGILPLLLRTGGTRA